MNDPIIPTRALRPRSAVSGHEAYLVCIHAPDGDTTVGKLWEVQTQLRIGRNNTDIDIVLLNEDVSRAHCKVVRMADNEFGVSDLGSSNGVYVQNVRIESMKLSHRKTFDVARQYKFMLWIGSKESPELVTLLKTLEAI